MKHNGYILNIEVASRLCAIYPSNASFLCHIAAYACLEMRLLSEWSAEISEIGV